MALPDIPISSTATTPIATAPVVSAVSQEYPKTTGVYEANHYGYNAKRYSGKILRKFYESTSLTNISNTDYQGEIKAYGDTVIIRTTPDIEVSNYTNGQNLQYKVYDTDVVSLKIDKGKYWAFVTNDVDLKQTDLKNFVENWTTDAANRMKIEIERDVFNNIATEAGAGNVNSGSSLAGAISASYDMGSLAAPVVITKSNVIDVINNCGSVMGEQNLPVVEESGNFWMVIPQWFANKLASSDLRAADIMGTSKSIILDGGQHTIPKIDVFDIYRSNLLKTATSTEQTPATVTYVMFGHKSALTFAAQLVQNESLKNPFGFGMLHRGLTIYGYKVVLPKALGCLVCRPGNA